MSEQASPAYVAPVTEIRISPDGHRMARRIPFAFTAQAEKVEDEKTWVSLYFVEYVGLTVEVYTDAQVADWRTVWRDQPSIRD